MGDSRYSHVELLRGVSHPTPTASYETEAHVHTRPAPPLGHGVRPPSLRFCLPPRSQICVTTVWSHSRYRTRYVAERQPISTSTAAAGMSGPIDGCVMSCTRFLTFLLSP